MSSTACNVLVFQSPIIRVFLGFFSIMASSKFSEVYSRFNLEEEDDGGLEVVEEEVGVVEKGLEWCLVGRVMTEKPVNFARGKWLRPLSPSRVSVEEEGDDVADLNGMIEENLIISNSNKISNSKKAGEMRQQSDIGSSNPLISGKIQKLNFQNEKGAASGEVDELVLDSKRKRLEAGLCDGISGDGPDFQRESMIIDPNNYGLVGPTK